MKIAFVVFDKLTLLDLVGFYDPVTRLRTMGFLPELEWDICGLDKHVADDRGLWLRVSRVGESLSGYDVLFLPGGIGTRKLCSHRPFLDWLATGKNIPLKASVCTGALLLGAAGFLENRPATTHPRLLDELKAYGAHVSSARIVDGGDVVTAGGVSASLDLGLYIVERLAGENAMRRIATQMDYPYQPSPEMLLVCPA